MGRRHRGFLDDAAHRAVLGEINDAILARVANPVPEDDGPGAALDSSLQRGAKALSVKEIVAQHQSRTPAGDELATDQEGLSETVRARLDSKFQPQSPGAAVAEQRTEWCCIVRRGYDQNFPDPRQHQCGQRIVNHRLIVDREQLLAECFCDRPQSTAGAAGEDDPLHWSALSSSSMTRSSDFRQSG